MSLSLKFCTVLLCLLAILRCQGIQTPNEIVQVYSVSVSMRDIDTPPTGSIAGGTTLIIRGAGFAPTGNIVTIGNFPCDTRDRISTPDVIVCDTVAPMDPAFPDPGNLVNLMVTVNTPGKYPGNCSRSNCLFSYSKDSTSIVSMVYPRSILPGQQMNVVGLHRVADKEDIAAITVGNTVCARGINRFGALSITNPSIINCSLNGGIQAGYLNFSEKTMTGIADKHPRTRSWSWILNTNYEMLVHPYVDSISQSSGSPLGHALVITGGGFSRTTSRNMVSVGGSLCDVVSSSETQIVCNTRPFDPSLSTLGRVPTNSTAQLNGTISGAGIRFKRYNISNLATRSVAGLRAAILANNSQAVEVESGIATELRSGNDIGGNYARVYRGYFKPPMNGSYIFRALADDQIAVYLSSVTGSADTQFINYSSPILASVNTNQSNSNTNYFMMTDMSLQSPIVLMNSSDVFYMEVWHLSGISSGSMMVSAEVISSTPPATNQGYDVFDLQVQPAQIAPEILQFVQSGTNNGLVNYRLTRFDGNGVATYNVNRTISWNATAFDFNNMLTAFDIFQGYDARVSIVRQDSGNNDVDITGNPISRIVYTVFVMRIRPDAVRSQSFVITSVSVAGATSTASEIVASRQAHSPPLTGAFSLSAGNRNAFYLDSVTRNPVQSMPLTVSTEQVREAVSRFYNCRWVDVDASPNSTAADGLRFVISIFNCSTLNVSLTATSVGLAGGLGGTTPQVSITRLKNSADSLWFEPITSEHLYTPSANGSTIGQVTVMVNQAISVCRSDCSYNFTSATTNVTSFTFDYATGNMTIVLNTNSTILTGNYTITLGGVPCVVDPNSSNVTNLNCTISAGNLLLIPTGDYWPVINVTNTTSGIGLVNVSMLLSPATVLPSIANITPTSMPMSGGALITIKGYNLPQSINETSWNITYCGLPVDMVAANGTSVTIMTPPCPLPAGTIVSNLSNPMNTSLNISRFSASKNASYACILTNTTLPNITNISTNKVGASTRTTVTITINGTGFGADSSALGVYLVNSRRVRMFQLPITGINDTMINATLLGVPRGVYTLVVSNSSGDATWSSAANLTIEVVLKAVSIVNSLSSPFGGNKITVIGDGFSPLIEDNRVFFAISNASFPCSIVFSNSTNIDCITPNINNNIPQANIRVISNGLIADMPNPTPAVLYNSSRLPWPIVTNTNAAPHLASVTYQVDGLNFNTSMPSILFAGIPGTVMDYTYNWLEYRIPATLPAGIYPTVLNVSGLSRLWNTTVGLAINNLSRVNGSGAGDVVCLRGSGILNITDPYVSFQLLNGANPVPFFVDSYNPSSLCIWFAFPSLANNQSLTFSYTFRSQIFRFNYLTLNTAAPVATLATSSVAYATPTITFTQTNFPTLAPSRVYMTRLDSTNNVIGVPGQLSFTVTGSNVICNVSIITSGQYNVYLFFDSQGLTLAASLAITGGTPTLASNVPSSWLGGGLITVTGVGLSNVSTLTVGGFVAPLVSINASSIVFSTPPILSPFTQGNYSSAPVETKLTPVAITTSDFPERRMNLIDGRMTTQYTSGSATCSIVFDMTGPDVIFTLNRARFFIPTTIADPIATYTGAKLSASSDNTAWTDLVATVENTAKNGWNEWRTLTPTTSRYVRFLHTSTSGCRLGQLEVYGQLTSSTAVADITATTSSTIKFFDGRTSTTLTGVAQYASATTPNVTEFSPRFISPKTTTNITINGIGFGSTVASVSVMIDGVSCSVLAVNNTQVNCTAQVRANLPGTNSFQLSVNQQVAAIICPPILYADRWSSNDTWGAKLLPVDGSNITVPRGMVLLVDRNTPRLAQIYVEGTLTFDDTVPSITLNASTIILNGGTLLAGSPQTPYPSTINIVMQNAGINDTFPSQLSKTILCNACKLRLYGIDKVSWASLDARSAIAGITTDSFVTSSAVNWSVGDEVVISTSFLDQSSTERRIISAINMTQKIINVTVPLQWPSRHIGNDATNLSVGNLTLSSQVGLLSRNIKIQGDSTFWSSQVGARIIVLGTTNDGLDVKLSNVELLNCGQTNNPRGYCLHFNMNGDMQNNLVRRLSVHDAVSRLLVLSGVSYLTIDNIVGFNHFGHGIALQNGAETNNLIQNNLILGTYPSYTNDQSDTEPASIWLTHPVNTLINNVAGGSEFDGISYELKLRSDGESSSPFVCPRGTPATLQSNLVHSNKRAGLRITNLISSTLTCRPVVDPTLLNPWALALANPLLPLSILNYTAHANGLGIWIGNSGALLISNTQVADFARAGIRIDSTNTSQNNITVSNTNIVGQTASSNPGQTIGSAMFGLITPRANWVQLSSLQFSNFASFMTVMQVCSDCNMPAVESLGAKYLYTNNVNYTNINGSYLSWNGPAQYFNFFNSDNSLTTPFNTGSRTVNELIPYFPHNEVFGICSNATNVPAWNGLVCSATPINPARTISIVNMMSNDLNNPFEGSQMNIKLLDNATHNIFASQSNFSSIRGVRDFNRGNPRFGWSAQFVDGQTYAVWWNAGIDFTSMTIVPPSPTFADAAAPAVILRFNATWFREVYEVRRVILGAVQNPKIYHRTAPLNATTCSLGDFYHDPLLQYVYLCISGRNNVANNEFLVTNIQCHRTCSNFRSDVTKEPFVRAWSNATQWPGGVVPVFNAAVSVPSAWTLIVDVDTAPLQNLTVDGDMLIYGRDTIISAQAIWIRFGSFSAGNSTSPLEPALSFVLNGARLGANFTVASNITANKLFVLSGRLELYGPAPAVTWTILTAQLAAGQTSMTVSSTTGWAVGDDIVIAPSFNNALEYERVTITGVSGSTVSFTPAAQFTHFGNPTAVTYLTNTLDMRSAVGHVSRKIKFVRGTNITDSELWGFRLLVTPVDSTRPPWINLRGVQFVEGGQFTPNTSAALHFFNTRLAAGSTGTIDSCSFTNCNGYCLRLENNTGLTFTKNVFYEGRRFIASVEGQINYSFTNNLMIGARVLRSYEPLNASAPIPDDVACYHQFKSLNWATDNNMVTDNLCQGSQLEGFVLPFTPCALTGVTSTSFARNTAGTCAIGFLLNGNGSCLAAQTLYAYACTVGVMANPPNTTRLQYSNLMLADNKRGLTLRNGYLNTTGDSNVAVVSNSWFSALSRPTCSYCYGASATSCSNNIAIRLMESTANGKLLPNSFGLSFDDVDSFGAFQSTTYVNSVNFDNFQPSYSNPGTTSCTNNTAFGVHPGTFDIVGSVYMTGCTGTPTISASNAIIFSAPVNDVQCGNSTCTAINNFFIRDNTANAYYIPSINNISRNESGCTANSQLNGSVCARNDLAVLQFESLASDNDTRVVWPVSVSYTTGNWTNFINAYRMWNATSGRRPARFSTIVKLQTQTNIVFNGQPPSDMRFVLAKSTDTVNSSTWTVVNINYPSMTGALSLTVNGTVMNPIAASSGNSVFRNSSLCGINKFFSNNNTLSFMLTSNSSCQVRATLTSTLSVVTKINSDLATFNANGGTTVFIERLAQNLGINPNRIVIRDLYEGSTIVDFQIMPDPSLTSDQSAVTNNLNFLSNSIQQGLNLGSLGPVISSSGVVNILNTDGSQVAPPPTPTPPVVDDSAQTTRTIIIATVCSVVGAAGIAVGLYFLIKKLRAVQTVALKAEQITCQSNLEPKKASVKIEVIADPATQSGVTNCVVVKPTH